LLKNLLLIEPELQNIASQNQVNTKILKVLIVYLRELERYVEFINMREIYQDFNRASNVQAL